MRENGFHYAPKISWQKKNNIESYAYIPGVNLEESQDKEDPIFVSQSAQILKSFHDLSQKFAINESHRWKIRPGKRAEVICHGDFAPYNLIVDQGKIVALIDYEYCHPNLRLWDVSYAIYRMAPFCDKTNPLNFGTIEQKIHRAELFLQKYDSAPLDLKSVLRFILVRLEWTINLIEKNANRGVEKFRKDLADNHAVLYKKDIEYCSNLLKSL